MRVSIQCPCGFYQAIKCETKSQAVMEFVEHHGWSYVRQATGGTKERGFDLEGICGECQDLDDDE